MKLRLTLLLLLLPLVSFAQQITVSSLREKPAVNTYNSQNLTFEYAPATLQARVWVNDREQVQPTYKSFGAKSRKVQVTDLPEGDGAVKLDVRFYDGNGNLVAVKSYTLQYKDPRQGLYFLGIGVGGQITGFDDLSWPRVDVQTIKNCIDQHKGGLYLERNSMALVSPDGTTKRNILYELDHLSGNNRPQAGESVILYLSGHGYYTGGEWYFITRGTDRNNIRSTALSGAELRERVRKIASGNARVFLFVDTCHAAGLYENRDIPDQVAFFAASGKNEQSAESLGWKNSAYAKAFVNAVTEPVDRADGILTVQDLQRRLTYHVTSKVQDQHPEMRLGRSAREDWPFFKIDPGTPQVQAEPTYKYVHGFGTLCLSLAPGVGQFYKKEYLKGGLLLGGTLAGAGGIIFCESQRQSYTAQIQQTHDINVQRNLSARAQNMATARNICIGATALVYIYNLVDAAAARGNRKVQVQPSGVTINF